MNRRVQQKVWCSPIPGGKMAPYGMALYKDSRVLRSRTGTGVTEWTLSGVRKSIPTIPAVQAGEATVHGLRPAWASEARLSHKILQEG